MEATFKVFVGSVIFLIVEIIIKHHDDTIKFNKHSITPNPTDTKEEPRKQDLFW